jgi:hypothetical protein
MSQQSITLENVGEVRRTGKIAKKVFVPFFIGKGLISLPVEKGFFLDQLKPLSADETMTATFDGQDLTLVP